MGYDFSDLNDDQLSDDYHYMIFPNITLNIHCNSFMLFRQRPHESDPNKMYFDFISLLRAPAQDVPRPEKEHYRTADGDTLDGKCEGGELMDEDLYNLPRIQAGMRSRAYKGLHLNTQEIRIRHFHKTLMGYIEA